MLVRDAADAADRGPQDRSAGRTGLQQFVSRRQTRQRRRPAERGDAAARLARDAGGRRQPRAGRRGAGRRSRTVRRNDHRKRSASIRSITIVREEVTAIPASSDRDPVIVATGPLTSEALSADIARLVGSEHLYFYDADQPDRAGREHRSREGVPRVALESEPSEAPDRGRADPPAGSTTARATISIAR